MTQYYQCPSNRSRPSGELLKKCIKACKKGVCWVYEKEQTGETYVYVEDHRIWFQKHKFETASLIISLVVGSYLIPKFLF